MNTLNTFKTLDPWYITGFCDGEAAFTYSRGGGTFGIYFAIAQREDNRQIIEDIRAFFGFVGSLYIRKDSKPARYSGFTKASAYYRVTKIDELQKIIEHFDKYPLQSDKKREGYKVWREMAVHKFENYRNIDYDKLRNLAERLSNLNAKTKALKVHKDRG